MGVDATADESAFMENVLTQKGKLLCIPCVKSIGANRKAVLLHQNSRKHMQHLELFASKGVAEQMQKRTYLLNIPIHSIGEGCLLPGIKSSDHSRKSKKNEANKESKSLMEEQERVRIGMPSSSSGISNATMGLSKVVESNANNVARSENIGLSGFSAAAAAVATTNPADQGLFNTAAAVNSGAAFPSILSLPVSTMMGVDKSTHASLQPGNSSSSSSSSSKTKTKVIPTAIAVPLRASTSDTNSTAAAASTSSVPQRERKSSGGMDVAVTIKTIERWKQDAFCDFNLLLGMYFQHMQWLSVRSSIQS